MYKKILLPIDINNAQGQEKVATTAKNLAKLYDATLHVMTVVPDYGMTIVNSFFPANYADQMMKKAQQDLTSYISEHFGDEVKHKAVVSYGTIYSEIVDYANKNKMDLVLMASHRLELKDYLLGPNAARVTRHAHCSVMIVRD